ncbi:acyl-CoA thioesterase [Azospirillum thermophilum]|uniref:4-hydroxybenzoyl-CoA thioesterase n=1 Tax=Azospirillum thermophilum TaxID=2202148 RepID=A0A2S2D014_9PROT|nr:thioesterase family protein [Azospirillum thermophilum]AWK90104.1 4-hydroxybenzoyl-CoA thioesterase [Azospirillum thermophilum]
MPAFVTQRAVRFSDCDPAGIVYFPRCFDLMNGVVEDWWTAMGFPWRTTIPERRLGLPTAVMTTEFLAPSFLGDPLTCSLTVVRIGGASLDLRHEVRSDGQLRFRAAQTVVCTSLDTHKSQPWPEDVRSAFAAYLESPHAHDPSA